MMALLFLISAQESQGAGDRITVLQVRKWTQGSERRECQAVSHKYSQQWDLGLMTPDSLLSQGPLESQQVPPPQSCRVTSAEVCPTYSWLGFYGVKRKLL